jgi:hypothetical protein
VTRKTELQTAVRNAQAEICRIDLEEARTRSAKLVGRCFKYEDHDSVEYVKVLAFNDDKRRICSFHVQKGSGRLDIEPNGVEGPYCTGESYNDEKEISLDEFIRAWEEMLGNLKRLCSKQTRD